MFGRHWVKARGKVIARQVIKHDADGLGVESEFVVDVTTEQGELFRAKVGVPMIATDFRAPGVGAEVGVKYEKKSRKVHFDMDDPALSIKALKAGMTNGFDDILAQPAGSSAATTQADAQFASLQALMQGTAHGANINDPDDPTTKAIREALARNAGTQNP